MCNDMGALFEEPPELNQIDVFKSFKSFERCWVGSHVHRLEKRSHLRRVPAEWNAPGKLSIVAKGHS